jgi:hypothetical protein
MIFGAIFILSGVVLLAFSAKDERARQAVQS